MLDIFISIACYRDPEIVPTIKDAFEKALNPRRLVFGVYAQMAEEDSKIDLSFLPEDQVRLMVKSHTRARGPAYARYIIYERLYRNELYYLQIDSHSRFVEGWDEQLVEMLSSLRANSVISTYPKGYQLGSDRLPQTGKVNVLKLKKIRAGVPVLTSYVDELDRPQRNMFWAAGFSFCYGAIFKVVPFDKNLKNLFWGEEFLMSLRFFTHNVRVYTPHKNVVFTLWSRNYRHTFWELKDQMNGRFEVHGLVSFLRLCKIGKLCGDEVFEKIDVEQITEDLERYGCGNKKSVEEYYERSGIGNLLGEENYRKLIDRIYFSLKLN